MGRFLGNSLTGIPYVIYFTGRDQLYCGPHEFMCLHAQKCIPIQLRCDRENDCNDWEDETNCSGNHGNPTSRGEIANIGQTQISAF